jgi:ribonuclease P protein component
MLPKARRLSKTQFTPPPPSSYTSIATPYFSAKLWRNELQYHRFGFVISKKVDKRAVLRNGLKRKMAVLVCSLPIKNMGYDMVFFMKKTAVEAPEDDIVASFTQLKTKI